MTLSNPRNSLEVWGGRAIENTEKEEKENNHSYFIYVSKGLEDLVVQFDPQTNVNASLISQVWVAGKQNCVGILCNYFAL